MALDIPFEEFYLHLEEILNRLLSKLLSKWHLCDSKRHLFVIGDNSVYMTFVTLEACGTLPLSLAPAWRGSDHDVPRRSLTELHS